MVLIFCTIPGVVLTIWGLYYILIMKNRNKKLLVVFVSSFIPSFLWGFDYLTPWGFIIMGGISCIIGVYFLVKLDE